MTESIISNKKECWMCTTDQNLHKHHIYEGIGRRIQSEKYGCWVFLCPRHHNMSDRGVHFNKEFDLSLKQLCQQKWEGRFGNREEFIKIFGRSYL